MSSCVRKKAPCACRGAEMVEGSRSGVCCRVRSKNDPAWLSCVSGSNQNSKKSEWRYLLYQAHPHMLVNGSCF